LNVVCCSIWLTLCCLMYCYGV